MQGESHDNLYFCLRDEWYRLEWGMAKRLWGLLSSCYTITPTRTHATRFNVSVTVFWKISRQLLIGQQDSSYLRVSCSPPPLPCPLPHFSTDTGTSCHLKSAFPIHFLGRLDAMMSGQYQDRNFLSINEFSYWEFFTDFTSVSDVSSRFVSYGRSFLDLFVECFLGLHQGGVVVARTILVFGNAGYIFLRLREKLLGCVWP